MITIIRRLLSLFTLVISCTLMNLAQAAGLDNVYSVSGQPVSITASGAGSAGGTYTLSLAKPANASLLRAYLVVALKTNSSGSVTNSQATLDGASLTGWDADAVRWKGSETFETSYVDVTSQVSAKALAAGSPVGSLDFLIVEAHNGATQGSGIVAVWSDPASDHSSAEIKLGALGTAPSTFGLELGRAWEATDTIKMGLGIIWSGGGTTEVSEIKVNDLVLTSTAGGYDDSLSGRNSSAYFTFGEETDAPSGGTNATDHEYYEIPSSFLPVGTSDLNFSIVNTSRNDGVFMVWETSSVEPLTYDFSDAPQTGTLYGQASHLIDNTTWLGATFDAEVSIIANSDASGDGADDDGITIPSLNQGLSDTITASVNGAGGYLQGWIDFNGDGDFDDSGEQVASNLRLASGSSGTINVPVSVPIDATTTQTFARFRWSTTSGLNATDDASTGEVEDYALTIQSLPTATPLMCSSPVPLNLSLIQNGNTLTAADFGLILGGTTLHADGGNGNTPSGDSLGSLSFAMSHGAILPYDPTASTPADNADEISLNFAQPVQVILSQRVGSGGWFENVEKYTLTATGGTLSVSDTGSEHTAIPGASTGNPMRELGFLTGNGTAVVSFVPTTVTNHISHTLSNWQIVSTPLTSLRIDYNHGVGAITGGVQAGGVNIQVCATDHADAQGYTDASHQVQSGIYLGSSVDAEGVSLASADALGDDTLGPDDDEDGVIVPTLTSGTTADVTISAANITGTGTGNLHAWIDFDDNGTFDTGEYATVAFNNGASADLTFSGYGTIAAAGETFARFRLTTDALTSADVATAASDGEVEDYAITIDAAAIDHCTLGPDTDGDGTFDRCDADDDNDGILDVNEGGVSAQNGFETSFDIAAGTPDLHITGSTQHGLDEAAYEGTRFVGLHPSPGLTSLERLSMAFSSPLSSGATYESSFVQAVGRLNGVNSAHWNANNRGDNPGYFELWLGNAVDDQVQRIYVSDVVAGDDGQWHAQSFSFTSTASYTHMTIVPLGTSNLQPYMLIDDFAFYESTDTDLDTIPNHLDLDSDNDGISDLVESGQIAATVDTNNDGVHDGSVNAYGVPSAANGGAGVTPAESADDTDTIANYLDLDSDGDGIPDAIEAQLTATYAANFSNDGDVTNDDSDGDGALDIHDGVAGHGGLFTSPQNTDGTGAPDYLDTDSDDDNLLDSAEGGSAVTGLTYADPNGSMNDPITGLPNQTSSVSEVDYRIEVVYPEACDIAHTVTESFTPSRILNVACKSDVSVLADGSTNYAGYCPSASVTAAYEISLDYKLSSDDAMHGVNIWSNAGGAYGDDELRTFDLVVEHAGGTLTMSGVDIGVTAYASDVKFVQFMQSGIAVALDNVTQVRISNLGGAGSNLPFKELQGVCSEDHSDAPASYGSTYHEYDPSIYLGPATTFETVAVTNDSDTDDGIALPTLSAGALTDITIPAADITGTGTGLLHAWIDFDNSGTFDAAEYASVAFADGASADLTFSNYGTTAAAGSTFARFRVTTDALTSADAATAASNGEVEDYEVEINAAASFIAECTATGSGDAYADEVIRYLPGATVSAARKDPTQLLGAPNYAGINGTLERFTTLGLSGGEVVVAFRDNILSNTGDANGELIISEIGAVETFNLFVFPYPETALILAEAGITAETDGSYAVATNVSRADVDFDSVFNNVFAAGRLQFGGVKIVSAAVSGDGPDIDALRASFSQNCSEVREPSDYSDAPVGSYSEASHELGNTSLFIGAVAPDAEASARQANDGGINADGDDSEGTDDEATLTLPTLTSGDSSDVVISQASISGSGTGTLYAWIDFDSSGTFDADEHATVAFNNGASADLTFSGYGATAAEGTTFARFRLTTDTLTSADAATAANDGEVEDYAITIEDSGTPFSCDNDLYQIHSRNGQTSRLDLVTNSLIDLANNAGQTVGGTGYRITDNFAYGTDLSGHLIRIDATGMTLNLGPVTAASGTYSTSDFASNTGDFSGDGYLHVRNADASTIYRIDVDTQTAVSSYTITPNVPNTADFAYDPVTEKLYGISAGGNRLYSINPTTGASVNIGAVGVAESQGWGATFADADGNIYAARNSNGQVYSFNTANGVATYVGQGAAASRNDGFRCHTARYSPGDDYSDAPISGTTYGDAVHNIRTGYQLGAVVDVDVGSLASASADGDATDDGVSIPALTQFQSAVITATVTGTDGYLQAWIDFNGNNAFDVGEQVAADLQDGGSLDTDATAGTIAFAVDVPGDATTNQTFARFRWSTVASLDATTTATDGEVEDYALTIFGRDYGDAPSDLSFIDVTMNPAYPTLIADNAASHALDGVTFLGAGVSEELDGQPTQAAESDDDDGVSFPLLGGTDVLLVAQANTIDVTASVAGFLNAWMDINQDGDWDDSGERLFTNQALTAGSNSLLITPANTQPHGDTYLRFRFTSASVASPTPGGALPDGEVEDYRVAIVMPEPGACSSGIINSGFENNGNGIRSETGIPGWAVIPTDPASGTGFGQRNVIEVWATGSIESIPSFEGVRLIELNAYVEGTLYQDVQTTPGALISYQFAHRGRRGDDTIDVLLGAPGATSSMTSGIGFTTGMTAWKVYGGEYTVPAGQYITRFSLKTLGSAGGNVGAGNLLDDIQFGYLCNDDYSDAPADGSVAPSGTGTTLYGEAKHRILAELQLGASNDKEVSSISSATANGDGADDDGVTVFPLLTPDSKNYQISVTASNATTSPGRLLAWIDFDGNGRFDVDEAAARVVPAGTINGSFLVTWSRVPFDIKEGNTFMRLRFTTDALNASSPSGDKPDGEVEDYAITIGDALATVSGRVYIDTNSNATSDVGEAGIRSTVVVIRNTATGVCRSATTNGNGDYSFIGNAAGNYELYQAHGETTPSPQNCAASSANNPTGYQSTTPDVITVDVTTANAPNQNFGEVAGTSSVTTTPPTATVVVNTGTGIALNPNHQGVVAPGSATYYAHVLTSEADSAPEANGGVRFTTVGSGSAVNGWSSTLYRDTDCSATLNGTEANTPINGMNFGISAGTRLCIINKVYAPTTVSGQDRYKVDVTATFTFPARATAPVTLPVTLTVTDVTTAERATQAGGESRLVLTKTVENITQGTAPTASSNQAKPGDFLKYHLEYHNAGNGPITELRLDDTVPPFTGFVSGSNVCGVAPTGMNCTANINSNFDELDWIFTGPLVGGAKGSVSYEVVVDN